MSLSSNFNSSSYELMEYLARKLLNKSKEIASLVKNISLRIPSDSSLLSSLSEVDTELKQAAFAIKALLTENKSLSLQLHSKTGIVTRPTSSLPTSPKTTSKTSKSNRNLSPTPKKKPKDTNEYSSELVMKIIRHPNTIVSLTNELGKNFMMKMLRRDITMSYLDKVNDIINRNIDKGSIVSVSERCNIPLRIRMANSTTKKK